MPLSNIPEANPTPQVITAPKASSVVVITSRKTSRLKKILIGVLIFPFLLIGVLLLIFIFLGLFAKDIPKIDDSLLLPKAIKIPDQENAFFELNEAVALSVVPAEINEYLAFTNWDEQKIQQIVVQNQAAFDKWDAALKKSSFQDPVYADYSTPINFKSGQPANLSGYQALARLNTLRFMYDLQKGDSQKGTNNLLDTLHMGQKLQRPGTNMIGILVGSSIKSIGLKGLQSLLPKLKLSKMDFNRMSSRIQVFSFDELSFKEALKYEYFNQSFLTDAIASGKFPDEFKGAAEQDDSFLRLKFIAQNRYYFAPNKTKLLYANAIKSQLNLVDTPCPQMEPLEAAREPFGPDIFIKDNALGFILFNIGQASFESAIHTKCTESINFNGTRLLIALRAYQIEHSSLPDSLEKLVPDYISSIPQDAYDNKPLKYSLEKKLIYSVGKDRKDDGGDGTEFNTTAPDYIIPINL